MKYKTHLQIKLDLNTDPFKKLEELKKKGMVLKAHLINSDSISVYYDNRQLTADEILDVTGGEVLNEEKEELSVKEVDLMTSRAKKHKRYNPILNAKL